MCYFFFGHVIRLMTLKITTFASITPSMSVMSKAERYLMFLANLMMNNDFFVQNNFSLDHFLFKFLFKRIFIHKIMIFGIFCKL